MEDNRRGNEKRRHLDSSQLACVATDCEELVNKYREEARQRQGTRTDLLDITQQIGESQNGKHSGESDQQLATAFNTNREYIHTAKVLKEKAPAHPPPAQPTANCRVRTR